MDKTTELKNIWANEQISLQKHLKNMNYLTLDNIKRIAGMDCAYLQNLGVCGYQIFQKETGEILEENIIQAEISQNYHPGFLYYREHTLMEKAYQTMQQKPDLICIDGNGILHPRFMGEATQFGILNQIATIGISKNLYKFEDLEKINHDFYYKDFHVGQEILLSEQSIKYAYVSIGFNIHLADAVNLVLHMQQFSQPSKYAYVTKGSDHMVRAFLKTLQTN